MPSTKQEEPKNKYQEALKSMCKLCLEKHEMQYGIKPLNCAFRSFDNEDCAEVKALKELVIRATPIEVKGVECPECEADISFEMGLPYFCWKCGKAFIREEE